MTSVVSDFSVDYPMDTSSTPPSGTGLGAYAKRGGAWILSKQMQALRAVGRKMKAAFTGHPAETRETYFQHLYFTIKTCLRFVLLSVVLFLHGVFPFLFTRTASKQIERIYLIMRSRIPEARREVIKAEYEI